MAAKTNSEVNGCTFQWKIENISHCWLKKGQRIMSPTFIVDTVEDTKWSLQLYPTGHISENNVGLYLRRERDCIGPNDSIEINYQLAFLAKDGSMLKKITSSNQSFEKDKGLGFKAFVSREKVFVTEKQLFLPEDTLTVQCTIWKKEEVLAKPKYLYARTAYKVNRRSFVWKINEFSCLKSGVRNKFEDDLIEFDIVWNEMLGFVKKLDIDIISLKESIRYFSLKISVVISEEEKEECGVYEYFSNDLQKGLFSNPFFSKLLVENKARFLTNDVLLLECECVSSNGTAVKELFSCGIVTPKVIKSIAEKEKPQLSPFLSNDLKSVFTDGICADTVLRTATQIFPAHKIILVARSPVFRKMFSNDMKESNSGHIDITDLENGTIHRMLLYMYTDTLEDLQLENACKLYTAADKYDIISLRNRCSAFLKDNLCPNKACDVLDLADLHFDNDLKIAVQDYILKHDREVIGSQEWKHLMNTNPKLAADVMYRKFVPL